MIHRRRRAHTDQLETELRTVRERIADRDREAAQLRTDLEHQTGARWDAAGEAEVLRDRVEGLTEQLADYRAAESEPAQRRARAAWRALWKMPSSTWVRSRQEYEADQDVRAATAQAILAMPLELFAGELTRRDGTYYLDGAPVHLPGPDEYGSGADQEALLEDRYGLTSAEISDAITQDSNRRAAAREAKTRAVPA